MSTHTAYAALLQHTSRFTELLHTRNDMRHASHALGVDAFRRLHLNENGSSRQHARYPIVSECRRNVTGICRLIDNGVTNLQSKRIALHLRTLNNYNQLLNNIQYSSATEAQDLGVRQSISTSCFSCVTVRRLSIRTQCVVYRRHTFQHTAKRCILYVWVCVHKVY